MLVRVERTFAGSCLVALGVLATLANLDRIDLLTELRTWWPASLVVWGVLELYNTLVAAPRREP